ncbi:hypothetical protein HYT23_00185 [Candidatus Pacearchaeota archaeon]|nr:hypothetical protein [Candidatus Pacearchaeota archaeon]
MKNIIHKIKESFNERNRGGTQMIILLSATVLFVGTQVYGMVSAPNIKVAREFDYCGKKAKIIVEERKLIYNSGYVLLNDNDVVRGTLISDNGDTITTSIDGYTINGELKRW